MTRRAAQSSPGAGRRPGIDDPTKTSAPDQTERLTAIAFEFDVESQRTFVVCSDPPGKRMVRSTFIYREEALIALQNTQWIYPDHPAPRSARI